MTSTSEKIQPTNSLAAQRHGERLTEQRNPETMDIDRLSIADALARIHAQDRQCFEASERVAQQVARAIAMVVAAFRADGRLMYVGAGTSGRLGVLDASEQPPTFGVEPEMVQGIIAGGEPALVRSIEGAEDDPNEGATAVDGRGVNERDVVMGITTGGRAPYVIGALARARELGAATILLTCTPPLEGERDMADLRIDALVGPEAVTGSTRMKAGTVTKLILNQITTVAMIQMGKVHENLMVDLKIVNEKLRDRAVRILIELTGLDRANAQRRLEEAGMNLKAAIVMTLGDQGREEALAALAAAHGRIDQALGGTVRRTNTDAGKLE